MKKQNKKMQNKSNTKTVKKKGIVRKTNNAINLNELKKKRKRRKKHGFTLIELLAVIVILGLLIAIAIPSVTKYITESRKKTVTTTIGNYISALVNDVNDSSYTFTSTNTIYAVPIECIALERGGTNPFGQWHQANDSYFAFVLVQYDDLTSSYIYGYTFKDSAGYGLYPISNEKINASGSQVKTGLSLTRPETGKITTLTEFNNWENSGFEVDTSTELIVLEAESEGVIGDGINTCTLAQKGNNYNQVEEEKIEKLKSTCRVTNGTGTNIGDIITCDTENFYVIENNASTLKVLSQYNITLSITNPRQSTTAGHTLFSSGAYWGTAEGKEKYGTKYPVYVFDENSRLYPYVSAYHDYLIDQFGLENSEIGLITTQKLDELGCKRSSWTCDPYPWIVSQAYWTGSASGSTYVWCAAGNNYFCNYDWSYTRGIRPVVTISKTDIKF